MNDLVLSAYLEALPNVSVGVRFHAPGQLPLLERCLNGIAAQTEVRVHAYIALQDFAAQDVSDVEKTAERAFRGSGFTFEILNVPNPKKSDLRSVLLNNIVDAHYGADRAHYLAFIDFDDIWFQPALSTLVEPLQLDGFAVSYADIHCADVYFDAGQTYTRGLRDFFKISTKTKRTLLKENFLPIHSYMFQTRRIPKSVLHYDTELARLEDYDVLLRVARDFAFNGMHRKRLIGLYNFYSQRGKTLNTSQNIFEPPLTDDPAEDWVDARRALFARHAGKPWKEFFGEEWSF